MRTLIFLLLSAAALLVPSCRHRAVMTHEGCFAVGGCHFVPQASPSHRLCRGEAQGELIGRVRSTGVAVRLRPVRMGKYSRYALEVWANGGARGKAELASKSRVRCAVVRRDGSVESLREQPESLPKDWVTLVALDGNICLVAWNRRNGGYNPKFYARGAKHGEAVYKVLEVDDPRYHDDAFPLREIRGN